MKLLNIEDQNRRDCWINIECENCGEKENRVSAYDDRNYWDNVLPSMKCKKCKKSSIDLKTPKQSIATKYAEGFQV